MLKSTLKQVCGYFLPQDAASAREAMLTNRPVHVRIPLLIASRIPGVIPLANPHHPIERTVSLASSSLFLLWLAALAAPVHPFGLSGF